MSRSLSPGRRLSPCPGSAGRSMPTNFDATSPAPSPPPLASPQRHTIPSPLLSSLITFPHYSFLSSVCVASPNQFRFFLFALLLLFLLHSFLLHQCPCFPPPPFPPVSIFSSSSSLSHVFVFYLLFLPNSPPPLLAVWSYGGVGS